MRIGQITALLATFTGVLAAPLESRAVIAHDAVVGFAQAVPSGSLGTALLKFKPWLYVVNGCVPFPAVDSAGNTGYVQTPLPWYMVAKMSPLTVVGCLLPETLMADAAPARARSTLVVWSMVAIMH
jgi:hypothetical protein